MDALDGIDALISKMNYLPEETGLTRPCSMSEICWESFNDVVDDGTSRRVNALRRYCRLMQPKSLRQQVYMLSKVFKEVEFLNDIHIWVTIGILLGKSDDQTRLLCKSYKKFKSGERSGKCGRPPLLNDRQIEQVIERVRRGIQEKNPLTKTGLMIYINETWQIQVSKRWISRLVASSDELVLTVACPIERRRAEVSEDELLAFYATFRELVSDVKPEFVFNMDETGFSRRARAKNFTCLATKDYDGKVIEAIRSDDTDNTFTLIAAVALDGSYLPPLIVSPCKTLPRDFMERHLWIGRDCFFEHSSSGFANQSIISVWYDKVFIPHLNERRAVTGNPKEKAILLWDGFSGHDNSVMRAKTAQDNVELLFLPAHSSHKTQPLDQYVFANMKASYGMQCESSLLRDRNSRKIYKMVKAFYRATDPFTIRESWAAVGISVLRDHKGRFCGIEADSVAVLANHVTLEKDRTKKKRALLSTTNRAETDLVSQGLCPCCRRPVEDPTASGAIQGQKQQITRIRLVIRTD